MNTSNCCPKCHFPLQNKELMHCADYLCPCHSPAKEPSLTEKAFMLGTPEVPGHKTTIANTHSPVEKKESWEGWVRILANSSNPRDKDLLVVKINVLLATQKAELVEKVKGRKLEQTKTESDSDWFFGSGYNQALDDVLDLLQEPND